MTDVAADAKPSAPAAAEEPKLVDAPAEAPAPAADAESATKTDGKAADAVADATADVKPEAETRADGAADAADGTDAAATEPEALMAKEEDDEKKEGDEEGAQAAADASETTALASTPAKASKASSSASRRKSVGQKLNRKASKARITHLDAKPGDHYFVKLKGYPSWPVIICDEEMLPQTLVKSRPVSAARQDGTYREDYADGGKRAADRTFPVMYLFTNEFGWAPNQDMHDLDPSKVLEAVNDKMRKDLQQAHKLAAESNPLSYYKDMLRQYQEDLERAEEAKRQALATPKKSKKAAAEKDGDVDMLDVPMDEEEEAAALSKKLKKRKAEDDARTPQRSDSVKKPKIKITSSGTPKSTNGTPTTAKSVKSKPKKGNVPVVVPVSVPPEPDVPPEERLRRKTKEVYFLRHKIQKSLLTRDQEPKAEEMKLISDYLTKLESFANLEVAIIRETKINKVLKAILKIESIPREDEFKFKPRSHTLLDKWSKLLAAEPETESVAAKGETNGASTNGHAKSKEDGKANGAGDEAAAAVAAEDAAEAREDEAKASKAEPESETQKESENLKEEPAAVEAAA